MKLNSFSSNCIFNNWNEKNDFIAKTQACPFPCHNSTRPHLCILNCWKCLVAAINLVNKFCFWRERDVAHWQRVVCHRYLFNPLTVKFFNLNFHSLEVASRWRDPQKWVKIIQIWQNGGELFSNLAGWCHILSLTYLKCGTQCANKKWKPKYMGHQRLKG